MGTNSTSTTLTCTNACGFGNDPEIWWLRGFFVEAVGTFILLIAVLATTDPKNQSLQQPLAKIALISMAITLVGTSMGRLTGFSINPARDLGPRIVAAIKFGGQAFTSYTWVPIVGPLVGAAVAVPVYKYTIQTAEDDLNNY